MQENLFLIEFMLTWPKTGRLRLFCLVSFRHSLELKSPLSWLSEFLLDGALMTSNTEGYSRPLLSAVSQHSLPSQNFFNFAKKLFASWLHPETFRCKPLRLSCLHFIFLLSMILIFSCKRWFVKVLITRCHNVLQLIYVHVLFIFLLLLISLKSNSIRYTIWPRFSFVLNYRTEKTGKTTHFEKTFKRA